MDTFMFYVLDRSEKLKKGMNLIINSWDDYGYKTSFNAIYKEDDTKSIDLGIVRIAYKGQESGYTKLDSSFKELNKNYFSIGSDKEYYLQLKKLGEKAQNYILESLNDIAYDLHRLEKFQDEKVLRDSLLRDIPYNTVQNQLNRIIKGGAVLTKYNFRYKLPNSESRENTSIAFNVVPSSLPPTNIHAIIGRNGVGKTSLIKNMIKSLNSDETEKYGYFYNRLTPTIPKNMSDDFSNLICVGFSAFDSFLELSNDIKKNNKFNYILVGLNHASYNYNDYTNKIICENIRNFESLCNLEKNMLHNYITNLGNINNNQTKKKLFEEAIKHLEYDKYFKEANISTEDLDIQAKTFKKLSSGHKIILLTIVNIVYNIQEKSIIILDEPETHLHPPLISAFIRALSTLLIQQNAISIITTHSPIILQEIPSDCAWKISRNGDIVKIENLEEETFGSSINTINRDVFGLDMNETGFNRLINDTIKGKNITNFETAYDEFGGKLGDQAQMILKMLMFNEA